MKDYKNKLFSVLGDSLSALDGYSEPEYAAYYEGYRKFEADIFTPEDTWWGQVINQLGGKLLVNNSIAGSMVSRPAGCLYPSYGCSNERTSSLSRDGVMPDVIMVLLGTNDWGAGKELFPPYDGQPYCESGYFTTAYLMMLDKLKKNYPQAEIWCFTLPVNKSSLEKELLPLPNGKKRPHLKYYCTAVAVAAEEKNCRVFRLHKANEFETLDGFHPNARGMKVIADKALEEITKSVN